MQQVAERVSCLLIGKLNAQYAVAAEERRRLLDGAASREACSAGLGTGRTGVMEEVVCARAPSENTVNTIT